MPEYSFDWAEQLRSLSEQEIKDYAAAAARLALIARALHTEEWHVLYREVALFSLVLLEQLEYSRGMLRKMGLDESLIKLER
jgi:acyl carrier protein phosphodiesterase